MNNKNKNNNNDNNKNDTYATGIPALDPLASGHGDSPADAILPGDPLQEAHVLQATRQYDKRKGLASYACDPPRATQVEVVQAKKRKHQVESANFDGPATPLWAQQLQAQMQAIQTQMQAQMQAIQDEIGNMNRRIQQESQRSMNRSIRSNDGVITPVIRLSDGTTPPEDLIPDRLKDLLQAPAAQINPCLAFYDLCPQGTLPVKKDRLLQFLGLTL